MTKKTLILRLQDKCQQEHVGLRKNIGLLDPKNMYVLIDNLTLNANPRLAKSGRVTDDIIDTLEKTPELFMYKSKGILLSSSKCETLERNRLRLTIENFELEGILDGGHNTFAIAKYFISCVSPEKSKKIKRWDDLRDIWDNDKDSILEALESENSNLINNFFVPVEIISPINDNNSFFDESIFEISSARNNNAELTATAKANYAGYYDKLAKKIDDKIADSIEWKTNEPNKRIKAQDIVSLSLIPIMYLQKENKLPKAIPTINPISIYSSKAKCINDFTTIMTNIDIGLDDQGNIKSSLLDSALDIMFDIPKIYDYIYEKFPDAYNYSSSGFGRITSVKKYENGQEGDKYLSRNPRTKFYNKKVTYKYPDGFIYPIVVGMTALMQIKENKISWKTDPFQYLENNLPSILEKMYISLIKTLGYDPQNVGKNSSSYQAIEMSINMDMIMNG